MHNIRRLLFLLIFLQCIHVNAADDIYFYHLGAKDGLSQVNILSIYQDEFGAMWFGSMEGLNRYNGMEMEVFRPEQHAKGLTQNTIYKMSGNKDGAIYLQSGPDLIRYDTYAQHFEIIHQGGVRAIAYGHDILWAIIDNKVMQYDEQTKQLKEYVILNENITGTSYIFPAKDGSIWIGSSSGLFSISGKNLWEQKIVKSKIRVDCIYQDKNDNIWVGTFNNGIFVIDTQGNITNYLHQDNMNSLSNNQIRSFVEDNSGKMWIATFYGLNVFDPKTGEWSRYVNDDNISHTLSHSSVFSLYKDKQGTIWAGTYFGGVNYFNPESNIFTFYEANSTNPEHLSFPYVGEMTEDKHGNLWICTEGGTLNCLNMKERRFSRYSFHHPSNSTPPTTSFNQKSIWYNAEKDLLYVAIHNVGLAVLNLKTKSIHIHKNDGQPGSLPNRTINKMQFHENVLYLMTQSGLVKMDIDTERFHKVSEDPDIVTASSGIKVNTFFIDSKSRLWILITNGVRFVNLKSGEIKTFLYDEANERSICRLDINNIFETDKGELFFASAGAGIFKYNPASEDFDNYTREKNNLESNYCYHISETPSGKLILLHSKSFSFFNSKNPDEYTFSSSPGFPIVGFNIGNNSYITNNGEIFIGGINGMVSFREDDLYKINKPYTLYFDKLFVNNEQIYPNDKSDILKETLPLCSRINLKYSQKNITVKFASSNYLQTKTHNYEYKLEGFDHDWIPTKTKIISYTNLNIGAYTLLIRETQKSENGNQTVYSLIINVKPPFYLTTIAFIVYGILIVLIIIGISRFWLWRTKMQTTLEFERKDKERIEELNRTKLRFFTNVSHEFRTPLTLITGQVESLLMQNDLSPKVHNKLIKTHKNTKHLLSLVSELLDFRKQEQGFYKLNIKHVELISYLEEIYDSFRDYATKSKIKYRFEHTEKEIHLYIDPVHLQKAIYNLLSNAFKYTSPNGRITLQVRLRESDVSIRIVDDGIGIPPESLNKIFEWFYQLEYRSSGLTLGTGIGLALTKEIVTAHKGEISVESALNEGSIFTIILKLGTSHFSKEELSYKEPGTDIGAIHPVMTDFEYQYPEATDNNTGIDETKPVVLIIDDNEPLLDMLTESFGSYYNVHTTPNGKDGLEMVSRIQPDLVLCDVMMPDISGKKVCYLVKNNTLTSHIPVILLTAQSSDNEMMEGYMFGADAYFIKPFNIKVLIAYCNNLIKNRRLLYQKYVDMKEEVTPVNAIEQNQELMDKVIMTIKKNFNNPEFDMNRLGMELGMGRSKLYSKIKEITGFTPNELTLNLKMQEAAHLLDTKLQMNISEIAFELGFSSTKYFTKCFKSFYSIVPQDWRRRNADHPKT
jgi:signal transduction histidine kinase/ligand-binding sensor domain-containing protein/DNA-binding response OmpR family regulator